MKTSTKFKAGCGILAVFGIGFVLGIISLVALIGAFIPLTEGWKSEKSKDFIANQMVKKLELTPEQEEQFRPLVHEELDRRWELRRRFLLESRVIMEENYLERAAEFLTEEQLETLRGILAKWQREKRFMLDSGEEESESPIVEEDAPISFPEESRTPAAEERVRDPSASEK